MTVYKFDDMLNGNIDEMVDALITADRAAKSKIPLSLRNNGKQKEGITIETKRLNGNCAEDIVIAAELLKRRFGLPFQQKLCTVLQQMQPTGQLWNGFLKPRADHRIIR